VRLLGKARRPLCRSPIGPRRRRIAQRRRGRRFAQRTPETLLDRIRPDVHVKSDQYRVEELPERFVVERHGGRIVLARINPAAARRSRSGDPRAVMRIAITANAPASSRLGAAARRGAPRARSRH